MINNADTILSIYITLGLFLFILMDTEGCQISFILNIDI